MSTARATTSHGEIRRWIEDRAGYPAVIAETRGEKGGGVLLVDFDEFGGSADDRLVRIDWEEFFRTFDETDLAFLYDEGEGRFSKFVERETAEA